MKDKKILPDQSPVASKFQLVLASAKRAKQLNFMAKERGLPSNQVASIRSKFIKPPTIALMEVMEGKVVPYSNNEKEKAKQMDSLPSEESSQEAKMIS